MLIWSQDFIIGLLQAFDALGFNWKLGLWCWNFEWLWERGWAQRGGAPGHIRAGMRCDLPPPHRGRNTPPVIADLGIARTALATGRIGRQGQRATGRTWRHPPGGRREARSGGAVGATARTLGLEVDRWSLRLYPLTCFSWDVSLTLRRPVIVRF